MAGGLRVLRRRMMTPSPERTRPEKRGFHIKDEETKRFLEITPGYFRRGFEYATETGDPVETAARISELEPWYRGFAYEGAAMGLAILDVMSPRRRNRAARLAADQQFAHNAHVGIGFAMGRLPGICWGAIAPTDPMLRWRTLDGYGFHQAFFRTQKYVRERYQDASFPWPSGYGSYANRAIDLGIGRALWFVGGADIPEVHSLISAFDVSRQPDLWSGAGLAATYAGGVNEQELNLLRDATADYQRFVAQGAAMAAYTRVNAGIATEHTRTATAVLCGTTPEAAADVARRALEDLPPDGEVPGFEVWRQRVQQHFAQSD